MSLDMERLLDAIRQVESSGDASKISPVGAKGPYQFMDATAKQYGVVDPFDEKQSRDGARRYMTELIGEFGMEGAITAYNGGPTRLRKRGSDIARMPKESREYLTKVLREYASSLASTRTNVEQQFNFEQEPVLATVSLFPESEKKSETVSLFPDNFGDEALRSAILNPQPVDKASRIYQMQLRTGLPANLIERNLEKIEDTAKRIDFDPETFRKESPLLAEWLAKNPTRAALTKGDYENLSGLEKTWQTFQAVPLGIQQGAKKERMMTLGYKAVKGTITPQEEIERGKLKAELEELSFQSDEGLPSWAKAAADVVGMQFEGMGGRATGALNEIGFDIFTAAGKTRVLSSAIEHDYGLAVGEAYDDLEDARDAEGNKIDPVIARYAALMVAVPNTALEFASLSKAVKLIPGAQTLVGKLTTSAMKRVLVQPTVMAALADFGKKYAVAVGTETFTEGMQKFLNIVAREIATGGLGEGVSGEDVEAIGAESFQAFKGSVVLGGLASGPTVIDIYLNMQKAEHNQQFMQALGDAAANSQTLANSPKAFGEYIEHLKENGPVKNVFIPVEQWDALFQSEAPSAAAEVFGNLKQYTEAKITGGDLVIPIETYAEKLAATQFHNQLIPHIRLNPGEMTPTEAAEVQQIEPQMLVGLQQEMNETMAKEAPFVQIYDDVYGKMRDVGSSNQEANRIALLESERVRARAERLGVDPVQLYAERPLLIERQFPASVAEPLIKYNQQLVEPPVPFADKLPLEGGEINLPPATEAESKSARKAASVGQKSLKDFGVFGATIHPTKGNLAGTEGVAVAGYPQRGVVTEGAPTPADLEVFMRRNRDIFQADPNAALGVWVDNESGKGYIDITNVLPRDQAIAQGEYLGEKAVWDLGAFEEIRLPTQGAVTQQVLFQGERGASIPARNMMVMFRGSDPSTPIHELGHLWLEELRQDAMRPDAPGQLKQDWETTKAYINAQDDAISTEAHETFARSIEAFVMEGKAPSFQLREVFSQFMNWMIRIYKSLNMLDVQLTDEMRDVFDRLLATDEAIRLNRERNEYHVPLLEQNDMTEAEYAAYRQLNDEAKSTAEDTFRAKVMKELKREKLQVWRDEKKALEPKVRQEILEIPIYRAAYWLWSGALPDGTKIEGMAATKLDKQALLDMGVTLTDLPFRYQENGLHPDVVAQLFGFPSGETLVRQLIGLPTLKSAIDEEVSRRIREEHGGIIVEGTTMEEAAMEVQNTQQIDVFNMELRILKRMGARREKTHPAVLKDIAREIISRKTLRELNPKVFEEAAIKAGLEARDAMLGREFRTGTGRNLDIAFDAVQKQMLNVFLFREASEQRKQANKSIKKWKRFLFRSDERLAKSYNMDMVGAARAIASVHGIGGSGKDANAYMRDLEQYDPETYKDMIRIVEMASSDGRDVEDLTVAEFGIVKDAIEGLWHQALQSMKTELEGRRVDRAQVVGMLNARTDELIKPGHKRAGYDRAVSKWDETKMTLLGGLAMLRRVEHWVDAMDGGDIKGIFRQAIWNPISGNADNYLDGRRITLEKYLALTKAFPKESARIGKIDAPEIGYEFRNKAELLGALRHTGNQSNLQKMLRAGRGPGKEWASFDANGNLDTNNWDRFIQRMWDGGVLTKADYDFIQGVWNLFEELKPDAWRIHKDVYGFFPSEVVAQPFKTPFGVYKGGYYPAKVDPRIVEDATIRAEIEALENRPTSFIFPSPSVGFTKHRSEGYAAPLSLELGTVPHDLETVLKFIHMKKASLDVGRIIIDKNFRSHLAGLDSEVASVMLMPWVQRSAVQIVEQPSGPRMQYFDKFWHAVPRNTAMQIMAANVSVALQNVTGLSMAATKVKKRYLAGAMWRFISSPSAYVTHIEEASTMMRNRNTSQLIEMNREIDNILFDPSPYEKAKNFADRHAYFLNIATQHLLDKIVWGAAYDQAAAEKMDEKTSRQFADSVVRETQGSFRPEDISRIEAGTAFTRTFTMFYGWFNMAANLNATEMTKALRLQGFHAGGRLLFVYFYGFMLPNVIAEAISQGIKGDLFDDDDDDGYLDNVLSVFFGGQFKTLTAVVPGFGQVAQTGVNMFNDKWYDDRIGVSPIVGALEATARAPIGIYKLATEDDVRVKRPAKDILTLVGLLTGLPAAPLAKPLGYLSDIEQGFIEEPDNPVEFIRGLVSGRAPE